MNESKLATAVMDWLSAQGWDCYPEVSIGDGARADIVGIRGVLTLICECKMSASMALWGQAIRWRDYAHFLYIAFPRRSTHNAASKSVETHLEKYYGIGKLIVDGNSVADSFWLPPFRRPVRDCYERLRRALHPDQKRYTPGSQKGFSSPWRRTMNKAAKWIRQHPGCDIKAIIEGTSHHYASDATARACLHHWLPLEKGIVVRTEGRKKLYYLEEES